MGNEPNTIQEEQKETVITSVKNVTDYVVKHPIKAMLAMTVVSKAIERIVKAFKK